MEYIEGIKISALDNIDSQKREWICNLLAQATMKQVFEDGFFHADPHPGNILYTNEDKIGYIDLGMIGRLNKKMMSQIAELLIGAIEIDEDRIVQAFLDIGIINEEVNIEQFKLDIYELLDNYNGKSLKQIDIVDLLNGVFKVAVEHNIVMPSVFTLLVKTLVTIEGICRNLYSDFNIVEFARPHVKKLIREKINIKNIIKETVYNLRDANKHLAVLPSSLNEFLRRANSGKLKIDFVHKGLEEFLPELNKMVNKLVLSIIIAALLVGSALVLQVNRGPFLYGFPLIGVVGFCAAAVFGILLMINILRSGKM